jgi:hypothetical protein
LINPLTAGFLVGGVEAARTGDLGKGLMAGLGAYGGAGLSSALAGTGAAAAAGAGEVAKTAGAEAAAAAAKEGATQAAQEAAKQAAMREAAQKAVQDKLATGAGKGLFGKLPQGVASFKNIGTGAGEIFKTGGAGLGGIGGMGAAGSAFGTLGMPAKAGLTMTAANALSPDMEMPEGGGYQIDDSYYESMGYSPEQGRFLGGQWRKGYPGFPPPGMAGGGVIPAPNGNYPLARPSESVGGYEMDIDPYTGEERFAAGGAAVGRRSYEEMPIDPELARPNSAKAGWMQYMQQNPAEQQRFIDAGYPAEFFQQNPETFTGNRPFIAGKDEAVRASEQARLAQQGIAAPSTMPQYQSAPQSADSFASYLQNLNQFVASPIAAPQQSGGGQPGGGQPGGGQPGGQSGGGVGQPGGGRPGGPRGGTPRGGGDFGDIEDLYSGSGSMKWDANQGRFVSAGPQNPFAGGMPTGNPFAGFGNIDFSAIQDYFRNAGAGNGVGRGAGAGAGSGGMPGGQNQFGGDQFTGPTDNQFGGDMGGDGGMMYAGGSKDFDETTGMYRGDTGQGFGTAQPDQSGAGTPDFSGMDFSNLDLSGLQNLNLSGMGGAGSYMPDMSAFGGGQEANPNPFADNYSPPADMGMGEVAYRGGSPSFDMTGGGREYTPPPEFSSGPIAPMQPEQATPQDAQISDETGQYDPGRFAQFFSGPMAPMQEPTPQPAAQPQPAPQQPAFDMGGMDFSGLAGLGALSGMPSQMAQAPEMPQQPAFDYGSMMAQQPAPSFDMGGFGGGMDYGAMQQPAQQPAPSFDMGGFGGGGGGGMDFGGMDFGSMGGFAAGGPIQYAAGGKFLRGPGDGMSDDIKANINGEQEARLADGEFVIPADVVSHIGNGSSEAGADRLYKMMANIRKARTGKTRQAPQINPKKYLPS